jgi:hypothetical protein
VLTRVLVAVAPYGTPALAASAFELADDAAQLVQDLLAQGVGSSTRLIALALDHWERTNADLAGPDGPARWFAHICRGMAEPSLSQFARVLAELINSHITSAATLLYALEFEERGEFGALVLTKALDEDNTLGACLGALARVGTPPPARILERLATHWPSSTQVLTRGLAHVSPVDAKTLAHELVMDAPTFVLAVAEQLRDVGQYPGWAYIASAILEADLVGARVAIEVQLN